MQNNNAVKDDVVEIDLQELLLFLLQKLWILIIFAVIGGAAAFLYTKFMITPMYQSTTSIYILNKNQNGTVTSSDLSVGTQLTKDYSKLITSRRVLQGVLDYFELNASTNALKSKISVNAVTDTRIIEISVKDADAETARLLADEVRIEASEVIKSVMDIEAVNVVDVANLPTAPVSPNIMKNAMMGALLGFVLIAAIFVVQFLMDDTIKSSEDVEKYLGLSVLASVPVFGSDDTKKSTNKKKHRKNDMPAKYEADFQQVEELGDEEDDDFLPAGNNRKEK